MQLTGNTIGGVKIGQRLGGGAFGQVYEGYQPHLERRVAVKFLSETYGEDPYFIKRFTREAKIAANVDHPNVVRAYDAGEADAKRGEPPGLFYIIMELVEGSSLDDVVKRDGKVDSKTALGWMKQSAAGLAAAHQSGLVHRDIKPANLMLDSGEHIKVADFGLARTIDRSTALTVSGTVLGTPNYMSPEQCESREADARSDLYSLGATFFHLLTGRPPFEADTALQVMYLHTSAPRPSIEPEDDIGRQLDTVIRKLLAIRQADRYQSADELLTSLRGIELGHVPRPAVETCSPGEGPRVIELRGDQLAKRGQWTMALAAYREASGADPDNQRLTKKVEEASRHAREEAFHDFISQGQRRVADGKYDEGLELFNWALSLAPSEGDRAKARRTVDKVVAMRRTKRTVRRIATGFGLLILTIAIAGSIEPISRAWRDYREARPWGESLDQDAEFFVVSEAGTYRCVISLPTNWKRKENAPKGCLVMERDASDGIAASVTVRLETADLRPHQYLDQVKEDLRRNSRRFYTFDFSGLLETGNNSSIGVGGHYAELSGRAHFLIVSVRTRGALFDVRLTIEQPPSVEGEKFFRRVMKTFKINRS